MSAVRPKVRRKLATVNEKALAGHVNDVAGILRSCTSVGRITVKPDTKYSCVGLSDNQLRGGMFSHTESTWDMEIENTNPISAHKDPKTSGLCLPKRSMRASNDSSTGELSIPCLDFSFSGGPGALGLATSSQGEAATATSFTWFTIMLSKDLVENILCRESGEFASLGVWGVQGVMIDKLAKVDILFRGDIVMCKESNQEF